MKHIRYVNFKDGKRRPVRGAGREEMILRLMKKKKEIYERDTKEMIYDALFGENSSEGRYVSTIINDNIGTLVDDLEFEQDKNDSSYNNTHSNFYANSELNNLRPNEIIPYDLPVKIAYSNSVMKVANSFHENYHSNIDLLVGALNYFRIRDLGDSFGFDRVIDELDLEILANNGIISRSELILDNEERIESILGYFLDDEFEDLSQGNYSNIIFDNSFVAPAVKNMSSLPHNTLKKIDNQLGYENNDFMESIGGDLDYSSTKEQLD